MMVFWFLVAAMSLLALAFVLFPLFRRSLSAVAADDSMPFSEDELNVTVVKDQLAELERDLEDGRLDHGQYDVARADLERELLYDLSDAPPAGDPAPERSGRWLAVLLVIVMPLGALGLYRYIGASALLPTLQVHAQAGSGQSVNQAGGQRTSPLPSVEQMVDTLAERMSQDPGNLEGWQLLGRSYLSLHRYPDAVAALSKAYELAPRNAEVIVAYAESLALANDSRLDGRPADLLATALQLEPGNPKALWLTGNLQFQQGAFDRAAGTWQRLLEMLPPDTEDHQALQGHIAEARRRAGGAPPGDAVVSASPHPVPDRAVEPPAQPAGLSVRVDLDPSLRDRVAENDTLFVFARAADGPKMPLAVVRKRVADLPMTITLDDSMAMNPALRLSAVPEVVIIARVSRAGTPAAVTGDLEGTSGAIAPSHPEPLSIVIDSVVP